MTIRKPKTVEITLRVRVPSNWTAAHAKREVSQQWYGEIYGLGPSLENVSLFPRYGRARVIRSRKGR